MTPRVTPRRCKAPLSKVTATKLARRASGLPAWAADMPLTRGKCHARGCRSRWGVTRVTIDFQYADRIDRLAHIECVACGRAWYRVRPPDVTAPDGAQRVRLTLIVPNDEHRRWVTTRGAVRTEGGDTAVTVADATPRQLSEARDAWRIRNDRVLASKARIAARKAEREAEAAAASRERIARWAERDAERAREEREAAAREAAMG